jgi:hypothetical protein
MKQYVFHFGFCTPSQWRANEAGGWDDESSELLLIEADSEEAALAWGRQVAQAFTAWMFDTKTWSGSTPDWLKAAFAHWVEDGTLASVSPTDCDGIQRVVVGVYPDFSRWMP